MEGMAMPPRLARALVLGSALAVFGLFAVAPSALAYGNTAQWQVGFSGTCSIHSSPIAFCPGAVHTGFWGWCAFGGTLPGGKSGTIADCQVTSYFGPASSFHVSYDVTGWVILPESPFGVPGFPDFLITSGTIELSGPGAASNPFGFPVGIPVAIPNPCPPMVCDTGIPPIPGHYSFHPMPGVELNIQVNQLS
jgi:hypothetical protein